MTVQGGGPPVIGVDLGGTKIMAAVVADDNRILGRGKRNTPAKEGGPAILKTMLECVDEALEQSGLKRGDLAAGGIGSPGPLDVDAGVILFSANLSVKNYPVGPELSSALGIPIKVQNDVRVGGYGEFMLGAGRGYGDVLAAFVGTGIGGCLIQNGRIVAGSTNNAGEIGHIVVKAGGPRCGCGNNGCMEAFASKTALSNRLVKAAKKRSCPLGDKIQRKGRLKSGDLAQAVRDKDEIAIREVERAAYYLGLGLGGLVNVFGPQIVVIGGGMALALGQPFLERITASARLQIITDPTHCIKFALAGLGDDAGVLGASLYAREMLAQG
ncbi:ROK family protein [Planctomyces sp. SH-PL62]|uniref:ROK family protein n=1 Tax=Planctomyces sp. SH-PL62 TaxID=1636152 RepID=UPI00078EACBD|nr:ROK family protein [Planctomyces sp. SH-PL62]AMV38211.1 Glucokinase [Planctomyces sp. SH-PL62]